jgi:hypothetical protein
MINLVFYSFYCLFKPLRICQPKIRVNDSYYPKTINAYRSNRNKPKWIVEKVIYLKAMMVNHGCGKIAATFNR